MRVRLGSDFLAGLLLASCGALGLYIASGYPLGTSTRMGAGFFPLLVSGALLLFGLLTSLKAFVADTPIEGRWGWRPLVLVLLAVAAFALTLRPLGLAAATVLLVGISALGGRGSRPWETALLGVGLALFGSLLFIGGLGVNVRVWPW